VRRLLPGEARGRGSTRGCSALAGVQVAGAPAACKDKDKDGGAEGRMKGWGKGDVEDIARLVARGRLGFGSHGRYRRRRDEPGRARFCRAEMTERFAACPVPANLQKLKAPTKIILGLVN